MNKVNLVRDVGSLKQTTIKDVARVANVSYATVSRAISGSPEIGSETRKRVLQICKQMGYTTNRVAQSMVLKRTQLLGLIVGGVVNPFMSELAYHIELRARELGYTLMLCNSSNDLELEEHVFKLLLGRQVDGIILLPSHANTYVKLKDYFSMVPTVFISENLRDLPESYVSIDNYRGTRIGTEYLNSLGHKEILYFGCRNNSVTHQLRVDGYLETCKNMNIQPHVYHSKYNESSIDTGYQMAMQLFRSPLAQTAIFAATDSLALGVLGAAEKVGIRVPEDLSVMGFDNITYAGLPKINLTTIDQPKKTMGFLAVDMLLEKITDPCVGYSHRILAPVLVERGSCRTL